MGVTDESRACVVLSLLIKKYRSIGLKVYWQSKQPTSEKEWNQLANKGVVHKKLVSCDSASFSKSPPIP